MTGTRLLKWVVGSLVLMQVLVALVKDSIDVGTFGYMGFGRLLWETGKFTYQDFYTYLPTITPYVYHEWLSGLVLYLIYKSFGGVGLQVLRYFIGLSVIALIYLTARKRGADFFSTAIVLYVTSIFLALGFNAFRAPVFTYGLYAVTLYVLESARLGGRSRGLWLLPPLMIIWANLHAGFLSGLGLIAIYAVGETLTRRLFWRYWAVLLLCILASLLTPYFLDYWRYLAWAVPMPRPYINEWSSFLKVWRENLVPHYALLHFAAIIILTAWLAVKARSKEITPLLAMGLTLYMGLNHFRHINFFMILTGAYTPVFLSAFGESLKTMPSFQQVASGLGRKIGVVVLACFLAFTGYRLVTGPFLLSLSIFPLPRAAKDAPGHYFPVGAVQYIRQNALAGKLLTEFGWGEFLEWNLYPQCRVALDGRYETVYPEEVSEKYFDFIYGHPGGNRFLEEYPPDMILIDSRSALHASFKSEGQWREVYADRGCALFLPRSRTVPESR